MASPRVLVMAGSARAGSFNVKLAAAASAMLEAQGASVATIDLRALGLPIYDGDLEAAEGVPAGAVTLVQAFAQADAAVIASPEYNAFPPPLLINALDWASRLPTSKAAMEGKPTAIVSASPGALGGLRSLMALRHFLALNLGLLVMPKQLAVGQAAHAFDAKGGLADPKQAQALDAVLQALLRLSSAEPAPPR